MMQLKAIFSLLLRRFEFELAQPAESYGNDLSKMVVAVRQPCRIRYRQREGAATTREATRPGDAGHADGPLRIRVDRELCQGHGVCVAEAPEVFALDEDDRRVALLTGSPPSELRERVALAVRHCPTGALSIEE